MPMPIKAIALGLLTAAVGLIAMITPAVGHLEIDTGLAWLFKLRGPHPAPEEVVIVAIDREASDWFGLPNELDKWPRKLHARLVRRLTQQGAAVIVFDIFFDESSDPGQSRLFAEAMRKAGNVILFEYLKKSQKQVMIGGKEVELVIEEWILPVPELARAAAMTAPFPLPKVPVRVSQAWLFKRGLPTLPVTALRVYARPYYADLLDLLNEVSPEKGKQLKSELDATSHHPDFTMLIRHLQELFQRDSQLPRKLLDHLRIDTPFSNLHGKSALSALIESFDSQESLFIDFYGPPLSITTIPYHQILEGKNLPFSLKGKAVFVGYSGQFQAEQKDGFHTVFSQPDGMDISGVEIAATVFANLLEHRSVTPLPLPLHYLVIILWGVAIGFLFLSLPTYTLIPATMALAAGYMSTACYLFASEGLWLPVIVPLLWQLPFGLLGALLWRHLAIGKAIRPYLPDQFWRWWNRRSEPPPARTVNGICLATDVQQYTQLAERLELDQLHSLLNHYFQMIFQPVKSRGGFVSDIKGDAIMAIWVDVVNKQDTRERACLAALDIVDAVAEFNRCAPQTSLPTRIGLHYGAIVLGSIGSSEHLEYRAVGDVVNAASRIENLNKPLGTRVLASSEVIAGLESIFTRKVGCFRVRGRRQPLIIHELVCRTEEVSGFLQVYRKQFETALVEFQSQHWQEAWLAFKALLAHYGNDGPSSFYLHLSERYLKKPLLAPGDGVVNIGYGKVRRKVIRPGLTVIAEGGEKSWKTTPM